MTEQEADELEAYLKERNEALISLDIEWARKQIQPGVSDETLLLSLHKARYEWKTGPEDLRRESERWLKENGHDRLGGLPWPENGELPK